MWPAKSGQREGPQSPPPGDLERPRDGARPSVSSRPARRAVLGRGVRVGGGLCGSPASLGRVLTARSAPGLLRGVSEEGALTVVVDWPPSSWGCGSLQRRVGGVPWGSSSESSPGGRGCESRGWPGLLSPDTHWEDSELSVPAKRSRVRAGPPGGAGCPVRLPHSGAPDPVNQGPAISCSRCKFPVALTCSPVTLSWMKVVFFFKFYLLMREKH